MSLSNRFLVRLIFHVISSRPFDFVLSLALLCFVSSFFISLHFFRASRLAASHGSDSPSPVAATLRSLSWASCRPAVVSRQRSLAAATQWLVVVSTLCSSSRRLSRSLLQIICGPLHIVLLLFCLAVLQLIVLFIGFI